MICANQILVFDRPVILVFPLFVCPFILDCEYSIPSPLLPSISGSTQTVVSRDTLLHSSPVK